MGIIVQILFGLTAFSQALSICPKDTSDGNESYVHECDSEGYLFKKSRFIKEDLAEDNFFERGQKRPYRRDVYISEYARPASYRFEYLYPNEGDYRLKETKIYDFLNNLVGVHKIKVDFSKIKRPEYKAPKALVIDSGFNWDHKDLSSKIYFNPEEELNGKDDDGDNLIDNITSLHGSLGAGGSVDYQANINQIVQLPAKDAPLSHGGFVASVVMKNIEDYSFIGVGGDIYSPVYLYKMLELINKHDLRVANMSFGFGDKANPIVIVKDSFEAISGVMMSAMNTLFVVAAGNGSVDFQESSYSEYPACFKFRNLLTIGALDTDEINEEDLETYAPAHFSNVGERCVDLFAPGVKVGGAGLANTHMKASGTSVSSPYVANIVLKMHEINGDLNSRELKKILLETAYVPQNKLPARSGGVVFPRRAYLAVSKTIEGFSVEDSIKMALEKI
ncbi:MAG: S8 family peptidase [Bdellovibrionales bacterium]